MFYISDGVRDKILTDVIAELNSGSVEYVLTIYDGVIPEDANAALASNNALVKITVDGVANAGISFESTPVSGTIVKLASETWEGTVDTSGTATFYRIAPHDDDGTASTSAKRYQGSVGTFNVDLLVGDTAFVASDVKRIDYFTFGLPESA